MQTKLTSLTKPIWSNAEHTAINCLITTSQFGEEILPFTADQNDVESHCRGIFADIVAGTYGAIGEYVALPESATQEQPATTGSQTL